MCFDMAMMFAFYNYFAAPHELTFLIISQNYSFSANLAKELKDSILNQVQIDAFLNSNKVIQLNCISAIALRVSHCEQLPHFRFKQLIRNATTESSLEKRLVHI